MLQNISDTFDKFNVPLLNKELHLFLYYKIKTYWPKMFEWYLIQDNLIFKVEMLHLNTFIRDLA